jgi:hypothetical protein
LNARASCVKLVNRHAIVVDQDEVRRERLAFTFDTSTLPRTSPPA